MPDTRTLRVSSPRSEQNHLSRRSFVSLAAAGAAAGLLAPAFARRSLAATVVRLGHSQPLTGPSAAYGIRAMAGAKLAVQEINGANGFQDRRGNTYTLEMTEADQANDPRQSITLFRQQSLDRGIVASLGPTNSVGFLPIVPVAVQFGIPLVGNGSSAPVKKWNTWVYRVNPASEVAVPILLEKVVKIHNIKRLAVLFDQSQDAQAADAEVCRKQAGALGYEIVGDEAFRSGDQDFSPQLTKIKANKPDAIYLAAATGDGVKVSAQVRAAGLDATMITGFGSFQDPTYWDGSGGAIKGGYTWLAQDIASARGILKQWIEKYNKIHPDMPATTFSIYGYDSVYAVVEAIKRAGRAERGAIREALSTLEFTSPIGTTIQFKNPPHGDNLHPTVSILRVTGRGTYEVV